MGINSGHDNPPPKVTGIIKTEPSPPLSPKGEKRRSFLKGIFGVLGAAGIGLAAKAAGDALGEAPAPPTSTRPETPTPSTNPSEAPINLPPLDPNDPDAVPTPPTLKFEGDKKGPDGEDIFFPVPPPPIAQAPNNPENTAPAGTEFQEDKTGPDGEKLIFDTKPVMAQANNDQKPSA